MKLIDLFAGIGSFSLAARWMGWQTLAFCEKDKFCQRVLRKNFGQEIEIIDDIHDFDGTKYRNSADIVCGGFPCQPTSVAGKGKGRFDKRFLWGEMFRVVRESQPSFVVPENARGLLTNEGGLVFEQVCSDLESIGYAVQTFIIPACAVNAPHKRDRVWIIAYSDRFGRKHEQEKQIEIISDQIRQLPTTQQGRNIEQCGLGKHDSVFTDTVSQQCEKTRLQVREIERSGQRPDFKRSGWSGNWHEAATTFCRVDDGLSRQLDRTDRLRALGNAIVPQIAFEIFRAIEAAESEFDKSFVL